MAYKNPNDPRKKEVQDRYNKSHTTNAQRFKGKNPAWLKEYARRNILKYRFGITLEEKVAMWEAQNKRCANPHCGLTLRDPRIPNKAKDSACIDHNHKCCSGVRTCGKCIRGLLCPACNASLGHMVDDRYRIEGLILYLNKHQGAQ